MWQKKQRKPSWIWESIPYIAPVTPKHPTMTCSQETVNSRKGEIRKLSLRVCTKWISLCINSAAKYRYRINLPALYPHDRWWNLTYVAMDCQLINHLTTRTIRMRTYSKTEIRV